MFSLNPPHLLSPATAFFTSSPWPQLGTFLLFISTRWWSQPLKQPRHHPHSSTTFLCVSLLRACTIASLGRSPRTLFVRSPPRPHPPFIGACGGTVSECVGLCAQTVFQAVGGRCGWIVMVTYIDRAEGDKKWSSAHALDLQSGRRSLEHPRLTKHRWCQVTGFWRTSEALMGN